MTILTETSALTAAVAALREIVAENESAIVGKFYETLLSDAEAATFLNNDIVQARLTASLRDWLRSLFAGDDIRQSAELQEKQHIVGQVHARVKIPMHVVLEAAIVIKREICRALIAKDLRDPLPIAQLAAERIDFAIKLMSHAYVKGATEGARLDEAYRLFSLDQDLATEKEAQRASLMDWTQRTLFSLLRNDPVDQLSASDFGMWIRHRADMMFQPHPHYLELIAQVAKVDDVLLPRFVKAAGERDPNLLATFQAAVDRISFLVADLFQSRSAMEVGRDPLTRTLNRRFLPAILGREVTYAANNGTPLSVMMIDVDHFKSINDLHGHQIGDHVLRQVAQVVMDTVRPSDFVFRYGGEEFLIVAAETADTEALKIAERLRQGIASAPYTLGLGSELHVTASIGLAAYNGHPDQSLLIKRADDALYQAKAMGRNRIENAL